MRVNWFKILVWTTILAWPLGQVLVMPSPDPQVRWYALDLLSLAVGVSLLFRKDLEKFMLAQPLFRPLSFFLMALAASLIVNANGLKPEDLFIAGSYWFRLLFLSLTYFALRQFAVAEKRPIANVATALFVILALGQYVFVPDTRSLASLGFDDHYYRLIGSFFDPNFTGLLLAAMALIAWHHFKGLVRLSAIIPLFGLALTFSRASYLAFIFGLIYMAFRKKWWPALGLIPLLFGFILAAPKPFGEGVNLARTYSIESRLSSHSVGIELFKQKPILGHGFNTLAVKQPKQSEKFTPVRVGGIDNSFLYILATGGIVGFLAFLYFLKSLWDLANWTPVVQAVLVAILFHSFWNNSFFYPWIYVFVMIMADYASLGKVQTK